MFIECKGKGLSSSNPDDRKFMQERSIFVYLYEAIKAAPHKAIDLINDACCINKNRSVEYYDTLAKLRSVVNNEQELLLIAKKVSLDKRYIRVIKED